MFNPKKKNPFDPIKLKGSNARWFNDYLNGKERDKTTEKNRKATLKRASQIGEDEHFYV